MSQRQPQRPKRCYRRRTVGVLVEYVSDAGLCVDPATTLGAGGIFIETESPLPEHSTLKMRFRLPGSGTTHEIEGRVVWRRCPRDPGDYSPGMGIEFTDRAAVANLARELETLK
jgi:Tfp pilus assembly protein PilZ